MKFEEFSINYLISALFIVCLVAFSISLALDNGQTSDAVLDSRIPYSNLEGQINKVNTDSDSWKNTTTSENPQQESGLLVIRSIWGVMKTIWDSFLIIPNLIFNMAQDVLGIPPIVTTSIATILIVLLIFAMWRVMKGAD